jgi:hypothetical protein
MKTLRLSIIAMLLLGAASCKKSNSTPGLSANVSSTEAIDMVSSSLSLNSNGVATTADDATTVASTQSLTLSGSSTVAPGGVSRNANVLNRAEVKVKGLDCGDTKNDTITRSNTIGSSISYQYTSIYTFTLHCAASLPDSLTGSSTFTGTYSGPFISSVYTGTTTSSVTGILPTAGSYTFNGTYSRNGNFQSKKDTSNHGSHTVNITVSNLTLSKSTRTITGGTATFSVTGNVPKKGDWSYSGTLVYNGDGTANLTVSGTVYIINLGTGIYVKKS